MAHFQRFLLSLLSLWTIVSHRGLHYLSFLQLKVQMQLICALIGFCSILAMQKQKRASASLFDRRKRINDNIFWPGTDISNSVAIIKVSKDEVGGKQVVSSGNVELV